jgi:hypothetical protein
MPFEARPAEEAAAHDTDDLHADLAPGTQRYQGVEPDPSVAREDVDAA